MKANKLTFQSTPLRCALMAWTLSFNPQQSAPSFDVISPRENIPTIKISPLVLRIALCNLRSIALRFGVCFIDRIENWILIHQSLNDIQPKRSIHTSHARVALPLIFWHSISTRQSNIYTVGRLLDFLRAWLGIVGRF